MLKDLFKEYLLDLNKRMIQQKRKILLIVDNAPPHCHLTLSNVNIVFYPANCTSEIQPMDQGIIKAFKSFYKFQLVNQMIDEIDNPTKNKMTLLDCIYWIDAAWKKVTIKTIQNCWTHAWHRTTIDDVITSSCVDDDNMRLARLLSSRIEFTGLSIENILDEGLPGYKNLSVNWDEELLENHRQECEKLFNWTPIQLIRKN